MSDPIREQADRLLTILKRHPRVISQGIAEAEFEREQLRASMPYLVPFAGATYRGLLPVLDWDHRLPSQTSILRIYAYYSEATLRAGEAELSARAAQIAARDKFPEFDVPDFGGLTADETYEGDVAFTGEVMRIRLVSSWRRDIDRADARMAVKTVRKSEQFKKIAADTKGRPDYLGDLEAVSWTPPCESDYQSWTIDVWYLMYLDAAVGKGRSFLIDPELKTVVGVREFVVRSM